MNHLISAKELLTVVVETLHCNVSTQSPPTRIFDCRHRLNDPAAGHRLYLTGHIPGAVHVHLDRDLSDMNQIEGRDVAVQRLYDTDHPHPGRHPLPSGPEILKRFGHWGVTPETDVVVYDDMGGAMAARLWWMLRAVGHGRVRVLNGGFPAWTGDKETVEHPLVVSNGAYPGHFRSELLVDFSEVLKTEREFILLDARAADRFRGEHEPLDPPGGHIPGAINTPFQDQLNADGTFKDPATLQALYIGSGADRLVASCGSGVTACHLILGLAIAGREDDVQLFPPSFSGWSRTAGLPIEK